MIVAEGYEEERLVSMPKVIDAANRHDREAHNVAA